MTDNLTLALDAMGGDLGPEVVIPGAALAALRHPGLQFIMFGDGTKIKSYLDQHPKLAAVSQIRHSDISVAMDEKPSQALRRGRNKSGMWLAIDSVHKGEAHAVVSAGNTGALMAMSRFILRTLPGIERHYRCNLANDTWRKRRSRRWRNCGGRCAPAFGICHYGRGHGQLPVWHSASFGRLAEHWR